MPLCRYKLNATITDETGVLSTSITDSVGQKIIGKGPDKLFAENTHIGRRILPTSIQTETLPAKNLSVQLLRTSAPGTIRFLLVDIQDFQPVAQSTIPQTPNPITESRLPEQNRKVLTGSAPSQTSDVSKRLSYSALGIQTILLHRQKM